MIRTIACFYNHRFRAIFMIEMVDIGNDFFRSLFIALRQFGILIPVRIDAEADHIPFRSIFFESVKNEIIAFLVTSAIQMDNAYCFRINTFHRLVSCFGETGILFHVGFCPSYRPQKAVGRLIAYLYPSYVNTVSFE